MKELQSKTTQKTVKVHQGPDFGGLLAKQQQQAAVRQALRQNVKDNAERK